MKKIGLLNNVPGRGRKYTLNEKYFKFIDNESKAYWLGFLMADGNIYNNVIRITLAVVDFNHLVKFKSDLKASYIIRKNKDFDKCTLAMSYKPMADDLAKVE